MKKISNFVLALGLVGAFGAASAKAGTPVTITFDGFCDGMTLNTEDGLVGGTLAGCLTGIAMGNKAIDYGLIPLDGTKGTISNVQSNAAGSSEILTYYLDFANGTWANYGNTGSGVSLINSGTFTVSANGIHGNLSGAPSSVKKGGNGAPQTQVYTNSATISFDGFCDGMTLSFSGDLISGSASGCSTGILAGNTSKDYGVEPFSPTGSGVAANVGSNVDGDGYLLVYYLDFANLTWANYDSTTGYPAFLRSGTFSVLAGGMTQAGNGPASSHR